MSQDRYFACQGTFACNSRSRLLLSECVPCCSLQHSSSSAIARVLRLKARAHQASNSRALGGDAIGIVATVLRCIA